MPASMTTPINEETLSAVWVAQSAAVAPKSARGMRMRMVRGARKERNWNSITMKTSSTEVARTVSRLRNDSCWLWN